MFQTTVSYYTEQNGVAESMNHTIRERDRSMLFGIDMPAIYWEEVILSACYLQKHLPGKATENPPYELWDGKKSDPKHIRAKQTFMFQRKSKHYENLVIKRVYLKLALVSYPLIGKKHNHLQPQSDNLWDSIKASQIENNREHFHIWFVQYYNLGQHHGKRCKSYLFRRSKCRLKLLINYDIP